MVKLYHETEQEAIDAIRHWFIPDTNTPERGTEHFEEKDGKDGYEAKIDYKPVLSVRYSEEQGEAAHPTKLAEPFPPFLWGVFSITDKEQEYMHALYDSLPYANQQARKLAWEQCYDYCAYFDTGCNGQGYHGNWAKRHYGDHIPNETNKGSEDRCFHVRVPMVDSSMSGAKFELYVRPVILNKTPSRFKAEPGAIKVEEMKAETGGKKRKRQPIKVEIEVEVEDGAAEDKTRPGIKANARIKPNVGKRRIGRLFRQPGDINESDSSRLPTEDEGEDEDEDMGGDKTNDEAESDGLSCPVFAKKWPEGYGHGGLF
ncbi:hypothetical protein HD553DRAFT_353330 [Filobasidium floriforme]|uniref:uncharacterized protein n=1 Tax=Filobasidium floriforme TaxID=5210 RepID=UPI001E8DA4F2|nr:uncharacterized protein HD553DRAFT_353330 [Filobasidium floriforme]KAH8077855.1 hypothetical protein HD553DRAFT_353330 [Filobasidium floriforme]